MITAAPTPVDAGSPADSPPAGAPGLVAWYAESFSDILGDRLRLFDNAGPALELLRLNPGVSLTPGFEQALRARVDALAGFKHPAFTRIRTVTLLDDPMPQLTLVSELAAGERLSAVMRAARASGVALDPTCAVWLLRHVLPALAAFHDATGGSSHGLLDPDRVVVDGTGDIAITEYVFGGLPGVPAEHPAASDLEQAAMLAVAVLVGRSLTVEERTGDRAALVGRACASSASADVLRPWLLRALAQSPTGFESAREAYHALDELLPGVWGTWPSRLLPGGETRPASPPALLQGAITAQLPAALLGSEPEGVRARRLWRISRGLAVVAVAEAVCIAVLIARGTTSPPSVPPPPPIQAAGLAPPPATPVSAPASAVSAAPLASALVAPMPGPALAPATPVSAPNTVNGWLVVESEVEVKVYVNGRLLGTAKRRRFGVPAGEHTVTLATDDLSFRSSQPVRILPGRSVLIAAKPDRQP